MAAECVRSWSAIGVGLDVRPSRSNALRVGLIEPRPGDSDERYGLKARPAEDGRETVPGSTAWLSVTGV